MAGVAGLAGEALVNPDQRAVVSPDPTAKPARGAWHW